MKALILALAALLIVSTGAAAEAREPGLYAELKTWQTGIGAFLGLVAIIAGALYNAKLNRDRDIRLRLQEIRGLCHALAAELTASAKKCEDAAARMKKSMIDGGTLGKIHFMMLKRSGSAIFDANLDKIGLLAELASEVVNIYEVFSRTRFFTDVMEKLLESEEPITLNDKEIDDYWLKPAKKAKNLAQRLDAYEPPEG